jgi:hypothetical protein
MSDWIREDASQHCITGVGEVDEGYEISLWHSSDFLKLLYQEISVDSDGFYFV